ncbi:MAG: 5-formyltetrahydrofolate cyclo-ligase [Timaviella obliquedivisa GSE-PSE-MK23-08B]|jgi:5-formyltetrahydrofolate cyclo-ligase|nr:5-formyltetrahydrofolate cyclo-ligase [Timaviella obliquedivisa GSE-PSE-MK23-08B]
MAEQIIDPIAGLTSKADLRRSLLKARRALAPEIWRTQSDRLCTHLQTTPQFIRAQTILAYTSFRQEPDLSSLIYGADSSKRWGLPRCVGKSLTWHAWSSTSRPLQAGAYGILEPHADEPILELETVDLILVPAVASDRQGYRLGYGGGFYDRLLSDPHWATKPSISILFNFALLPHLPIDPWDRPLHAICTEAGLFWINR